jgi:hypothetical protein
MTMGNTHHLGELGEPRPAATLTFGWFGSTMRVGEDAGDLQFIEFMEHAMTLDANDQVEGMRAVTSFLRSLVHADDWDEFWLLAKRNRQDFTDLMNVAKAIVQANAGFPTGRPSDSSSGRPSTNKKSKGASSSRRAARALQLLDGRPDLKMGLWQASRARTPAAG